MGKIDGLFQRLSEEKGAGAKTEGTMQGRRRLEDEDSCGAPEEIVGVSLARISSLQLGI